MVKKPRETKPATDPGAKRIWTDVPLPFEYQIRLPEGAPSEVVLLLHGFAENGPRIFKKLEKAVPKDRAVLAPSGTFPMAHKNAQGEYLMVHSWYFYDPASGDYVIDMQSALEFLEGGVRSLGLEDFPKRIVGFSQGGYLAPFAALRLGKVKQVIGVACEYLDEELAQVLGGTKLPFRVDGVHGALDDIVKVESAVKTHEALKKLGAEGELTILEKSAHRVDSAIAEKVAQLLAL